MRRLLTGLALWLLAGVCAAQPMTSPDDRALANNRLAHGAYVWSVPSNVTVANGTTILEPNFPWEEGAITSVDYSTATGTFTADVKIGGVVVASCNTLAVSSSSNTNVPCTGANGLVAGSAITVVISSAASTPDQAVVKVNFTHTVR
jgi:hypothetical protein